MWLHDKPELGQRFLANLCLEKPVSFSHKNLTHSRIFVPFANDKSKAVPVVIEKEC